MSDYVHWKLPDLIVEIAENTQKLLRRLAGMESAMTQRFDELSAQLAQLEASNAALVAENQAQSAALVGIQADVTFLKENIPAAGGMTEEEVNIIRDRVMTLNTDVAATVAAEQTQTATAQGIDAQTDPTQP